MKHIHEVFVRRRRAEVGEKLVHTCRLCRSWQGAMSVGHPVLVKTKTLSVEGRQEGRKAERRANRMSHTKCFFPSAEKYIRVLKEETNSTK